MKLIPVLLTMILFFCLQKKNHCISYHLNETETDTLAMTK